MSGGPGALWRAAIVTGLGLTLLAGAAGANDLYTPGPWPAMASDRTAQSVGDTLTVVIFESSTAANSVEGGSERSAALTGAISGGDVSEAGDVRLRGTRQQRLETGRTGRLVAQISVTVEEVLPNGDLRVAGEQTININGKRTLIKVRGRLRREDILASNTVLSTRLADAVIDYDGRRFSGRKAAVNLARHISWLWKWGR